MEPNNHPQEQKTIPVVFPTVEPYLTYILLGILVTLFVYVSSLDQRGKILFQLDFAKINEAVFDGQYYRLLTSMFLHFDLTHLGFNALALYIFGRDVESLYGHVRFAIIYFMGGLAGSIGSLLYTDGISIGASGAIFAVFSAMGVYLYHHRRVYGRFAALRLQQMVMLGIINIAIGLAPGTNIDNAAHLGGAVGGFILGWFISPAFEPKPMIDYGNQQRILMVDTNTPDKWILAPILFGVGIIMSVGYASAVLG